MRKFRLNILALLLILLASPVINPVMASEGMVLEQGQIIDLAFVRQQVLETNRDYLSAQLDLESAEIQLTNAIADNLQRASAITVKQAESSLKTAQRSLEAAAQNVQLEAETKYYNLIKASRQLQIAEEALAQAEEQLRIIQARHAEGMATNINISQAQQAVLQSENSYKSASNNLELAEVQLNSVLGLDLSSQLAVVDADIDFAPLDLALDKALTQALENNIPLLELQDQLEIAKLDEKSATNNFTAPLLAKSKTLQRQKLELRVADLQEQIYLQTMELYYNVQALSDNYQASLLATEIAEENYRIIQVRFDDGLEIPVDLLSGRLDLARAKQQSVNSLFDYNVAKSQLLINLGLK